MLSLYIQNLETSCLLSCVGSSFIFLYQEVSTHTPIKYGCVSVFEGFETAGLLRVICLIGFFDLKFSFPEFSFVNNGRFQLITELSMSEWSTSDLSSLYKIFHSYFLNLITSLPPPFLVNTLYWTHPDTSCPSYHLLCQRIHIGFFLSYFPVPLDLGFYGSLVRRGIKTDEKWKRQRLVL